MKVLLVRHGETLFNQLDLTQGWCDSPLTEKGKNQAAALADKLRDYSIDAAYSSTSDRAYDTAEIVLGERKLEIRRDRRLKEMNFGVFEGSPNRLRPSLVRAVDAYEGKESRWNEIPKRFDLSMADNCSRYGGENIWEVLEREKDFLDEYVTEEDKTILIAGHGLSLSCLIYDLTGEEAHEKYPEFGMMRNASAALLEYHGGKYSLLEIINRDE